MTVPKKILILIQLLILLKCDSFSQNSYGWERIFDSIYGINGFCKLQTQADGRFWTIRSVGDFSGTGPHNFIKYNPGSNSWYPVSNSILKGVRYYYQCSPHFYCSGYSLPAVFAISPVDSNFILFNTFIFHDLTQPYDIRLFYSYNNGSSKSEVGYFGIRTFTGLAINPENDSIIYAASSDTIFISVDRAFSWVPKSTIPYFRGALSINPFNTDIVYAIDDSLYLSSDSGNNFNFITGKDFGEFIYNFSDSSILTFSEKNIYKSTDYGFKWTGLDSFGLRVNVIEIDPDNEQIIYAGTDSGLYKSTDAGINFHMFNNSFTPTKKITGICKVTGHSFVYVVTEEAVYKCWNSFVINVDFSSENVNSFELFQNYPNPFNPISNIDYYLPIRSIVNLAVYDQLGKQVAVLVDESQNAGQHRVVFQGNDLSSGVYFYKIKISGGNTEFTKTKNMILLK